MFADSTEFTGNHSFRYLWPHRVNRMNWRGIKRWVKSFAWMQKEESADVLRYFRDTNHYYPMRETQPQDIFVAGFPKSGNTWMQHMLSALQFGMDPRYAPDKLVQELTPDVHLKPFYKRYHDFCFFKTHDLPLPHMKRVVHLVRDGRDAMASFGAMKRDLGSGFTLEGMILRGDGLINEPWYEHCRQWIENPHGAEILLVRYEDLLEDTARELNRICDFAGLGRSQEEVQRVVDGSSFGAMKKKEQESGWDNPRWKNLKTFVRQGKTGSYRDEIPPDLLSHFEREAAPYLKHFGYLVEEQN